MGFCCLNFLGSDFLNSNIFVCFRYNVLQERKTRCPFFDSLHSSLLSLMSRIENIHNNILRRELLDSFRKSSSISESVHVLQYVPKRRPMVIWPTRNEHSGILDILKNILIWRVTWDQIIEEFFLSRIPEFIIVRRTQRLLFIEQAI